MDSHPLVKLAHMLHRVCFIIVNGKGRLLEPSRKYGPFYVMRKRRLGKLIQRPAHGIISQALRRWASVPTPPIVLFLMGEGLTWGSPRFSSIVIITFIVERHVKPRMRLLLLCMEQLSLQIVYFSLHGSLIVLFLRHMAPNFFWLRGPVVILSLKHMTAHARVALASLSGVYASLSKPSIFFILITFEVRKVTLLLGFGWFGLMGACLMRA